MRKNGERIIRTPLLTPFGAMEAGAFVQKIGGRFQVDRDNERYTPQVLELPNAHVAFSVAASPHLKGIEQERISFLRVFDIDSEGRRSAQDIVLDQSVVFERGTSVRILQPFDADRKIRIANITPGKEIKLDTFTVVSAPPFVIFLAGRAADVLVEFEKSKKESQNVSVSPSPIAS
jgi:hypothetical protein